VLKAARPEHPPAASAATLQMNSWRFKTISLIFLFAADAAGGCSGLAAFNTLYFLQLFNQSAILCASQVTLLHFHILGRAYPNIFTKGRKQRQLFLSIMYIIKPNLKST
jgi:hypothetical protein